MSKYDEDINDNPFFQAQLSQLSSFEEVAVILVPQKSSLPSKIEPSDLQTHIIIEKNKDQLQTQSGHNVFIQDSLVTFGGLQVPILFNETHYGQDWEKVKILCIQRPLTEESFEFHQGQNSKKMSIIFVVTSKLQAFIS